MLDGWGKLSNKNGGSSNPTTRQGSLGETLSKVTRGVAVKNSCGVGFLSRTGSADLFIENSLV